MKHSTIDIAKILRSVRYGPRLRPSRDWLALISLTVFLILVSVGWNLWMFSNVTGGASIGSESPLVAPGAVSTDVIMRIFEHRAIEEAWYRGEYRFVDPSSQGG